MESLEPSDEDIDYEFYEAIEATFEEILVEAGEAYDDERVPGRGPDRPDDVVAVLISKEYKRMLDLPFFHYGAPLSNNIDILQVPVVVFPPLREDYSLLLREDAEALFDGLTSGDLAREDLQIASRVLATFETLQPPYPHQPDMLREEVGRAAPGELSGPWPAA